MQNYLIKSLKRDFKNLSKISIVLIQTMAQVRHSIHMIYSKTYLISKNRKTAELIVTRYYTFDPRHDLFDIAYY